MRKGITPIEALMIVLAASGALTIIAHYFFREEVNNSVEAVGQWIIVGVNEVESVKRMNKDMLLFAAYQGIYEFGRNGGAMPTDENVYWAKYDQVLYPEETAFKGNLKEIIETRMNSMIDTSMTYVVGKVKVKLSYFTLNPIDINDNQLTVYAVTQSPITASSDIATVQSTFATSRTVETRIFRLYQLGKEVVSELKSYIKDKRTYSEITSALSSLKAKKDADYSSENVECEFVLGSLEQNSVEILVKLKDKSRQYPVFDSTEQKNKYDFISLEFFVLYGI